MRAETRVERSVEKRAKRRAEKRAEKRAKRRTDSGQGSREKLRGEEFTLGRHRQTFRLSHKFFIMYNAETIGSCRDSFYTVLRHYFFHRATVPVAAGRLYVKPVFSISNFVCSYRRLKNFHNIPVVGLSHSFNGAWFIKPHGQIYQKWKNQMKIIRNW